MPASRAPPRDRRPRASSRKVSLSSRLRVPEEPALPALDALGVLSKAVKVPCLAPPAAEDEEVMPLADQTELGRAARRTFDGHAAAPLVRRRSSSHDASSALEAQNSPQNKRPSGARQA